jgi:SAM-dependent methyltransferase
VRERRNVFGEVAELYDARRPGYPAALYDAVLAAVPGARRALEAGAGTGRANAELARRGLRVDAVEADAAMAAVARRATAGLPVDVHVTPFEDFRPEPGAYDLVAAAQAWHWIGPTGGGPVAAAALREGGVLALWWNRWTGEEDETWRAMREAYTREAPELVGADIPPIQDVAGELPSGFADQRMATFPWTAEYGPREYTDLLRTHSDHRMLEPERLDRLMAGVERAIGETGGRLRYPYRCELLLARREPR